MRLSAVSVQAYILTYSIRTTGLSLRGLNDCKSTLQHTEACEEAWRPLMQRQLIHDVAHDDQLTALAHLPFLLSLRASMCGGEWKRGMLHADRSMLGHAFLFAARADGALRMEASIFLGSCRPASGPWMSKGLSCAVPVCMIQYQSGDRQR